MTNPYATTASIIYATHEQALIRNLQGMKKRGVLLSKISVGEALETLGDGVYGAILDLSHLFGKNGEIVRRHLDERVGNLIDEVDGIQNI